ncbi:MAG: T9SS type A sorting domain-containing protein [Bacteroidetes bacterium]|nr:MAG: T9SS type A sorting domain-containing protein [Bacteroidota bacterium]
MRLYTTTCLLLLTSIVSISISAQIISGRVFGESGKPASHVTVQFRNKSSAAITNADGKFTITAKRLPDTLVFSAPGYESYRVIVTEETVKDPNFEIVLLSTRTKAPMAEVMVAGRTKREESYSVSTDDGEADKAIRIRGATTNSGGYIRDKKLFMIDSMPGGKDSVIYRSGLLTAGEVNDFNKWKMWEDFQENEFKIYSDHWGLYPKQRYSVQLQNKDHIAVIGQPVFLINKKTKDTVWSAVTDNTGKAELWADMHGLKYESDYVIVSKASQDVNSPSIFANGVNRIDLNSPCSASNTVDIAFAVDATGSMSDEIDFLKIELEDVIRNTFAQHPDLDLHVGSVFYRDRGDEYLSRHIDFQTDLLKVLNFIKLQRAGGGGDMPEAVDVALQTALDSLHWSSSARTRILFLVLDAPPHDEAKEKMFELIRKASAKGVRIVPVVCSGADKSTEFIMRSIALATNGDYVFLTDDSGVGLPHIKPTTDVFKVEFLNSLLERIIKQMVFANKCSEQKEVENFKNTPLNIEKIKIYPNPTQGNIAIESKKHLKEIYVTDFTGKILMRVETNDKQTKWYVSLSAYPNATYLIKYITADDQWGAEKVVLIH